MPVYNIPGFNSSDELILSKSNIVRIFAGNITHWNDTRLLENQRAAVRSKLEALDNAEINVFVREDKSGTTEICKSCPSYVH